MKIFFIFIIIIITIFFTFSKIIFQFSAKSGSGEPDQNETKAVPRSEKFQVFHMIFLKSNLLPQLHSIATSVYAKENDSQRNPSFQITRNQ